MSPACDGWRPTCSAGRRSSGPGRRSSGPSTTTSIPPSAPLRCGPSAAWAGPHRRWPPRRRAWPTRTRACARRRSGRSVHWRPTRRRRWRRCHWSRTSIVDPDPEVRAAIACLFGADGPDPRSATIIDDLMSGPGAPERIAGLGAIRRLGEPVPIERVNGCLRDPAPSVRVAAIQALAVASDIDRADPGLLAALDDDTAVVRTAAATALSDRPEAPAGLLDLLTTGSARTQAAALRALRGHGPEVRQPVIDWTLARLDRATDLRQGRRTITVEMGPDLDPVTSFLTDVLWQGERRSIARSLDALVVLGVTEAGGIIRRCIVSRRPGGPGAGHRGARFDRRPRAARRARPPAGGRTPACDIAPIVLARLADDDDPWIARLARRVQAGGTDMPETSQILDDLETMLSLRRVPLFEGLEPEDLQRIASTAVEHLYPPGEALVREGDVGDELVVIVEGSVRVVHLDADGTERLIRALPAGRPHRRARGPARGAPRGDGHRRGRRRRPRPGHRRRRRSRRSCANGRMPRWRCSRRSPSGSARRHDRPWPTCPGRGGPTLPTGTVTFLRTDVEGSMGLARTLGTALGRDRRPTSRARSAPPSSATAARSSGPRATRCSRCFARGRSRRSPRPSTIQRALAAEPGRPAARSGCGWVCIPARRIGRATTTAASTSTARLGSRRSVTAARSSCPRPTATLVADAPARRARRCGTWVAIVLRDVPRPERLSQLDIAGLPCDVPAAPDRGRARSATCPIA